MFKAVFFDLDGTLANSLFDLAASTNHSLEQFGYAPHPTENFCFYAGNGIAKMIERALPEGAKDVDTVKKVMDEFCNYYSVHYCDKTVAYDGLTTLIEELKNLDIKVAVITNKAQRFAEEVVHKLYGDSFDVIFGMREGIPAKPDPTATFEVMKQLCVKPDECAFIGDTSTDIATGVNSGAYPIGVLWGFRGRKELKESGAKAFAANADELKQIITGKCM